MHEIPADATEIDVSTHSRPKAAAYSCILPRTWLGSFNTQPPEGGCLAAIITIPATICFNTQPPEGGCLNVWRVNAVKVRFQHTAARRRLLFNFCR